MVPPGSVKKGWSKPKAPFCPTRPQRKEILQWILDCLFFPDGYAANIMRGVNLSTLRITGLKSHDYHVWLERVMPVMIRGYVDEDIWLVLTKLSFFFRQLCAKELDKQVVAKLEAQAPDLLCDLEAIFPPGFFNPMQHLLLHLPSEARLGGPYSTVGCIQLRGNRRIFETKARINAALKHLYVRHTLTRRWQTSPQNTIMTICPLVIIRCLVTMSSTQQIYPNLAFSQGSVADQVATSPSQYYIKSGRLSCRIS